MSKEEKPKNIFAYENTDCMGCGIFTGGILIVTGLYIHNSVPELAKRHYGRFVIQSIGFGLIYLGFARMLVLPPFYKQTKLEELNETYIR